MTNHDTRETPLEWHGFTAIWFNPDGKLRDFTPGVSRFLKDAEEIVPDSRGNWFIIEENSTDAEVIASAISTRKVPGTRKLDGSPVYSEGVSGEAYLDGDPDNLESDNSVGRFRLHRAVDRAGQQTFDLILHRSTFPMLSDLVRSAAKHLHPDYISGSNIAFNQDMINARTASKRAVSLVGLVSWIRGLHPQELAGYPVTNVEEYEGGLYFEAISDQAGTTLAQLADHLEHIGTRHTLGLPPNAAARYGPTALEPPPPSTGTRRSRPTWQASKSPRTAAPFPSTSSQTPREKSSPSTDTSGVPSPTPPPTSPALKRSSSPPSAASPPTSPTPSSKVGPNTPNTKSRPSHPPPTTNGTSTTATSPTASVNTSMITTSPPVSTPTAKPPHETRTSITAPHPGPNSPGHDRARRPRN